MTSACTSCSFLGNMRVHLGNVRALLFNRCSQILLYPCPKDSGETRGGVGALRTGRWGPEPWGAWRRWSPSEQEDRVWSRGTRGGTGSLSSRETGFRATRQTPEPSCVGWRSPTPQDTRQRVVAHPASCLGLKLICEVPDLHDTDRRKEHKSEIAAQRGRRATIVWRGGNSSKKSTFYTLHVRASAASARPGCGAKSPS
jgi:hypothetical protein